MATQTLSASNSLLRRALQGDGLFGIISGLVCIFAASPIASYMGLAGSLPILVLGIVLIVWGVGLFALSSRAVIDRRLSVTVILANVAWVIGSLIILAADLFALSTGGRWALLIVADMVTLFAIAEFVGLRRMSA